MAAGVQGGFGKKVGKVCVLLTWYVWSGARNFLSLKGIWEWTKAHMTLLGKDSLLMSEKLHCHSLHERKPEFVVAE